jgi:hypothetical protein
MKHGETRVLRTSVQHLSEDEYYWALMEPAWGELTAGTSGQRVLASTTLFLRDVANGGLEQALWNFDTAYVNLVLESLDKLEASEQAAIVRAAIELLLGESPPESLEQRRALIYTPSQQWLDENILPLSEQLYDEARLWPHYQRYIDEHPSEFFIAV